MGATCPLPSLGVIELKKVFGVLITLLLATSLSFAAAPGNTATKQLTITVNPALQALVVTTNSLPNGFVGSAYSAQLNATGGLAPYTWGTAGGQLPPGVTLNAQGVISGTPTAEGSFTFTVQVTDSFGQITNVSVSQNTN